MNLMLRQEQNLIFVWVNMLHLGPVDRSHICLNLKLMHYKKLLWLPVYQTDNRRLILGENIFYIRRYNFCELGGKEELYSPSLPAEPCTRVGGEKWNEEPDVTELQSSTLSLVRCGEHCTSSSESWLKLMRRVTDRVMWLPAEAWLLPASLLTMLSTSTWLLACGHILQYWTEYNCKS